MTLHLSPQAVEDIIYWNRQDKNKTKKIKALLESIQESPFTGLGKPEPLRFDLKGNWSRRIDREHRLVYSVEDDVITVHSCRFHYGT